jgi:hypothetical protein
MSQSSVVKLGARRTVNASPYLLLPLRTIEQVKKFASALHQSKNTVDSIDAETPTGRNAARDEVIVPVLNPSRRSLICLLEGEDRPRC